MEWTIIFSVGEEDGVRKVVVVRDVMAAIARVCFSAMRYICGPPSL